MSAFPESKLDSELVSKAVNALLKFEAKKATEGSNGKALLVSNYAKPVLVQIQLFNDVTRAVTKPTRVKIPHSMFSLDEEDNTICLFCRSDDKDSITQYLEANPIEGLTKVISINEAKKHYVQFKDKKALLMAHSHFICDSRITNQLYNILGSTFSARNDHPVQINFTNPAQLPELVKKVISSTYFRLAGKNLSIRLGLTNMKPTYVIENILEGVPFAIEKLQNEWKDVHSIHLKTSDSAALPIYSKIPNEMQQYVTQKAATTTPGKNKKAVVVAEEKVVVNSSTPAAKTKDSTVTSTKKRKVAEEEAQAATTPAPKSSKKVAKSEPMEVEEEEVPAPAPMSARKTPAKTPAKKAAVEVEEEEVPAPAPKSARKTPAKTPAKKAAVEEEEEEVPASVLKSARKTPAKTPAKKAAVEEEEEEVPAPAPKSARKTPAKKAAVEEEEEEVPAPAPKSARKTPAKTPAKKAAVEEEEEEVPAPAPKSARKTPAKTPAKKAAADTTTPAAPRTQPRRAASARK